MRATAAVLAALLSGAVPAGADVITVLYTARAATVVKQPFGLTVPLNTVVTGYFTFDTGTVDIDPSPIEGAYPHLVNAGFLAEFLTARVTGSPTPYYQVDLDLNPDFDTFRIYDGPRPVGKEGGIMSLDGTGNEEIQLLLAVSEDVFDDDALINPFPFYTFGFLGTPHTFSLKDEQGTMLLQLTSVAEAVCGDATIGGGVTAGDALQVLRTAVGTRNCVACLCDVDHSGAVSATDALKVLRFAVSAAVPLECAACL